MPSRRERSFSDSLSVHDIRSTPTSNARAVNAISWFDKLNRINRADMRASAVKDLMENSNGDDTMNKEHEEEYEENKINSNEATSMLTPSVTATREFATPSRVLESNSSIKDETTITRLASMISPIQPTSHSSDNTYDEDEHDDDDDDDDDDGVEELEEEGSYTTNSNNSNDSVDNARASHSFHASHKRKVHDGQINSASKTVKSKAIRKQKQESKHGKPRDKKLEIVLYNNTYDKNNKTNSTNPRSNSDKLEISREHDAHAPMDKSDVALHNSTNFSSALLQNISQREGASLLSGNYNTSNEFNTITTTTTNENSKNNYNKELNMLIYNEDNDRAIDMYDNAMQVRMARERWLSVEKARRDKVQELKESQECTFHPRLSPYARKMRRPRNLRPDQRSSAEVLYRQLRHALMQRAEAERELTECTFRPLTLRRAKLHVGVLEKYNNCAENVNSDHEQSDAHNAEHITPEAAYEHNDKIKRKINNNNNNKKENKANNKKNNVFDELYTEARTRQHFENVLRPQIVEEIRKRMANRGTNNGDNTVPMSEEKVQEVVNRLFSGATRTQHSKEHGSDTVKATVSAAAAAAPPFTTHTNGNNNNKGKNFEEFQETIQETMQKRCEELTKIERVQDEKEIHEKAQNAKQEIKYMKNRKKENEQEKEWIANDLLLEHELKVETEKERKRLEQEAAKAAEAQVRESLYIEYVKSILTAKFEALAFHVAQNTHRPFRRHDRYPVVELAKVTLDVLDADEAEEVLIILENCNVAMINVHKFIKCVLDYVKTHPTDKTKNKSKTVNSDDASINGLHKNSVNTQWLLLTRAPPLDPETRRRACSAQRFIKSLHDRQMENAQAHHGRRISMPHIKRAKINPAELERIRAKRNAERAAWERELMHRRAVERGEAIDDAYTFQPAPRRQIPYACRPDIVVAIKETKTQQLRRAMAQEREVIEEDDIIHATINKNKKMAYNKIAKYSDKFVVHKATEHASESNQYATHKMTSATPTRSRESTARELFGTHQEICTKDKAHEMHGHVPFSTSPLPAQPNAETRTTQNEQSNVKLHSEESDRHNVNREHMLQTQPAIMEHPTTSKLNNARSLSKKEQEHHHEHKNEHLTPRSSQTITHDNGPKRTSLFSSVTSYAALLANGNNIDKVNHAVTKLDERKGSSCDETNKPEETIKELKEELRKEEERCSRQRSQQRQEQEWEEEGYEQEEDSLSKRHCQQSKHYKNGRGTKTNIRNLRDEKEALMHLYHNAVTEYATIGDKMTLSKLGRELLLKQLLEFQQSRSNKREACHERLPQI